MNEPKIKKGDFLYHVEHGLVKLQEILNEESGGKAVSCYALLPLKKTNSKTRYLVNVASLEKSGFHLLVSTEGAKAVLDYFKKGIVAAAPKSEISEESIPTSSKKKLWDFAQIILSVAFEDYDEKSREGRRYLERAAKGLIEELSYAFGESKKETLDRVKDSLGSKSMNKAILAMLVDVSV